MTIMLWIICNVVTGLMNKMGYDSHFWWISRTFMAVATQVDFIRELQRLMEKNNQLKI